MKNLFVTFFLALLFTSSNAVNYKVSMEEPHKHYFKVEMSFKTDEKNSVKVKMPVWAPGSYLVREFAGNVDFFEAYSNGKALKWEKSDKNTWKIETGGAKDITVSYKVYAYTLSVRTSFLDADHGYINGTSVFMYVSGKKEEAGELIISPWKGFSKVSCGLERVSDWSFRFPDYDVLADSPIEIGNHSTFSFTASGVNHEVAMFGEGNYDVESLKTDMAKVIEECTKVYGENPNKYYLFIIHNLTTGSGGLEHLNSTTLQVNRWTYSGQQYIGFLSLVAHEYFHLWNVKRSRPKQLGPFDYDEENYTTLLWVMEGFTSYYDELLLKRAGFHSKQAYLGVVSNLLTYCENTPGNKVQSAAESSFDAWIKGYRTNENSVNSQISYYTKGQVLGFLLDLEIIASTNGKKKLDYLMKFLYEEYYKKQKRGFTAKEFQSAAEKIAGKKLDTYFDEYVYKTTTPDYEKIAGAIGLTITKTKRGDEPWLGARLSDTEGKLVITSLTAGGSGYESGLNVNDEIVSIDGWRADQSMVNKILNMKKAGETIEFVVSRDSRMKTIPVVLRPSDQFDYKLSLAEDLPEDKKKLADFWLE